MDLLTIHETAAMLRVSPITVRRYIASGKLAAIRVGKGIRLTREAIAELIVPIQPSDESEWERPPHDVSRHAAILGLIGVGGSPDPTDIATSRESSNDELRLKPFTERDPYWDIVGMAQSNGPADIAENKHRYLAELYTDKKL